MSKQQPEYILQKQVCQYLRMAYPDVLFLSDSVAFCKLSMPQAIRNKAIQNSKFHCPDLIILKPNSQGFHGLFLELKIETPFKKNGELKSNEHLQNQSDTLDRLNFLKYKAEFVWSFNQAKELIDNYMNNKLK